MERLGAQDASFLYLEGPSTPYHVASLGIFEGGTAGYAELAHTVAGRLHLVPRFRQKLASVHGARPAWVDDVHFDLGYHVREMRIGSPAGLAELERVAGELMEGHLDRSRPLWEMWLLQPLDGDRFAVLTKTHHCVLDGTAGADAVALILDPAPDAPPVDPQPWTPAPPPAHTELVRAAVRERVSEPFRLARDAAGALLHPSGLVHGAAELARAAGALTSAALRPAPHSPLNVACGPNRVLRVVGCSLDDVVAVKRAFGGTVNDAVLTAVAGALGTWLEHRGVATRDLELRAMVPMSLRNGRADGRLGNEVSTIVVPLPVGEPDARVRFARIAHAARRAKRSHQEAGGRLLFELGSVGPPALLAAATRVQNVQRMFNLVVTNIRGPESPLYALGHRMTELVPIAPLSGNMTLIVAVMSYAGRMSFGLLADPEVVDDLDVFAGALDASISGMVRRSRM